MRLLYAVCLRNSERVWISFYWAEDDQNAEQQAAEKHEGAEVLCATFVPRLRP